MVCLNFDEEQIINDFKEIFIKIIYSLNKEKKSSDQ